MAAVRWVWRDAHATGGLSSTWTMPRNPAEMSDPTPARTIRSTSTTCGVTLISEGAPQARQWTFKGLVDSRALYDELMSWRGRQNRITITDHFGRLITCVPVSCELAPRRFNRLAYWLGDYTFTATVLSVGVPTVSDLW